MRTEDTVTIRACGDLEVPRSDSCLVSASEVYYAALNMNESDWHCVWIRGREKDFQEVTIAPVERTFDKLSVINLKTGLNNWNENVFLKNLSIYNY